MGLEPRSDLRVPSVFNRNVVDLLEIWFIGNSTTVTICHENYEHDKSMPTFLQTFFLSIKHKNSALSISNLQIHTHLNTSPKPLNPKYLPQ